MRPETIRRAATDESKSMRLRKASDKQRLRVLLCNVALVIMLSNSNLTSADAAVNGSKRSDIGARSFSQVTYISDRTHNRVLIYPANRATPIGAITHGLVEPEGLAVDRNGDLFVANGNGGNVLEYAPGGAGPIRTYATGLRHPVNVTTDAAGNIFVAEQSPSSIVEYPAATPIMPKIYPLPNPQDPVRGVAVDLAGDILASVSGFGDSFPLAGNCLAVSELYVIPFGTTTPIRKFLSANEQAFGLAVDAGTLYASDPCLNNVAMYSLPKFTFEGFFRYAGAFNQPFYITVMNRFLSVPSAGEGTIGYVTVVSFTAQSMYYSLPQGSGPISAVVGFAPAF